MLIKIILALAIAVMFMGGIGAAGGITGFKTAIADKQLTSSSALLDKAIVNWYTTHDYELPDSITQDMLNIMGLHDIDLSKFTYTKLADNKFRLVAALSTKRENSINSDRELPLKPEQDTPSAGSSSSGSSSSGGTTTPGTGDNNNGTTTPDNSNNSDGDNTGGSTSGGSTGGDSGTSTPDNGSTGDSGNNGNVSGSTVAKVGDVIDINNDGTITIPDNVTEIVIAGMAGCHHKNNLNGGCGLIIMIDGKPYPITGPITIPVSAGKLPFSFSVSPDDGFATDTGEPVVSISINVNKIS